MPWIYTGRYLTKAAAEASISKDKQEWHCLATVLKREYQSPLIGLANISETKEA